jgi:hypothetical protein
MVEVLSHDFQLFYIIKCENKIMNETIIFNGHFTDSAFKCYKLL